MMEKRSVYAPYNFVPFSSEVQLPYETVGELPRHDRLDPERKTGEIRIAMTAETPVFLSDGKEHFFRGANGAFMIPGSSVRGMVRENMQILGFGLVKPGEDLQDYQIYFREIASAKGSNAGGLKKYYGPLWGQTVNRENRTRSPSGCSRDISDGRGVDTAFTPQRGRISGSPDGIQMFSRFTPAYRK